MQNNQYRYTVRPLSGFKIVIKPFSNEFERSPSHSFNSQFNC